MAGPPSSTPIALATERHSLRIIAVTGARRALPASVTTSLRLHLRIAAGLAMSGIGICPLFVGFLSIVTVCGTGWRRPTYIATALVLCSSQAYAPGESQCIDVVRIVFFTEDLRCSFDPHQRTLSVDVPEPSATCAIEP
jgi:hypothetical protein